MSTLKTPTLVRLPRSARSHLRRADPRLFNVIERVGPFRLEAGNAEGPLCALVRAIVFQQLSGKVATTIYGRLRALFPADRFPTAAEMLAIGDEAIRACGISAQKLGYLRDLAGRVAGGQLELDGIDGLDDEAVIERLTTVRGLGRWSAQMFLIFYLGRLDVWPDGDLGIRSALRVLHEHPELPSPREVAEHGTRYRPYATVASWYLWRLLDLPAEEREALATD